MQRVIFLIVYPIIWCLSRLPMWILYRFSDVFFFIIYYLVGYRKKVIYSNIQKVFPEKTDKEIKSISRKFYRHLTDLIFESVKSFTIPRKELAKRYTYTNVEVINNLYEEGYDIVLVGSHHNNWEWSFGLPIYTDINCYGAYTRIKNPYFEKVIKSSRTRFGYDGVPTVEFYKSIQERVENKIQSLYILLSDQSPQLHKTRHWSQFLNNYVPVHTGAEILSKKHNLAIVCISTTKIKRGYYSASFELITKTPNEFADFELTEKFLAIAEKHIYTQPEYYLWSHKRFKHMDKYDLWEEKYKR